MGQLGTAAASRTRTRRSAGSNFLTAGLLAGLLAGPAAASPAAPAPEGTPADVPPANAVAADETAAPAADAAAEQAGEDDAGAQRHSFFSTMTVTATGSPIDTFRISTPVTVVRAAEIRERAPDNAADLLRDEPGVDVNGVGPNQARPVIRGLRGLRVLFLEDGMRLNNARRQTDFGEITGLVDVDSVETMEVVRGPASVLYGTDAVGGVLNLITNTPSAADGRFAGDLGVRYASAGEQQKAHAGVAGALGAFAYSLDAGYRDAGDYDAPSGSFGGITLGDDTPVHDTGLQDESLHAYFGYRPEGRGTAFARLTRYRAGEAGFGFVDPETIGDDSGVLVRILYPFQDFDRYTLGFSAVDLASPLASTAELTGFYQSNERELSNDILIDIGPIFPGAPNSEVRAETLNFTDVDTLGLRAELTKTLSDRQLLTYGFDFYDDDSFNTDRSTTTTILRFFPGPGGELEFVEGSDRANSPNAGNLNYGLFVQDEILAAERLALTLGLRYARAETAAEPTPGWDVSGLDFADDAVVGAVSAAWQLTGAVKLVGSVGRAFRAPNIIERLFNGPTPEGIGFQVLNPDLESERSTNVDLGVKVRTRRAYLELIAFRNDVDDAIIQHTLTAEEIARLPPEVRDAIEQSGFEFVVQQQNAEVLEIEGVEVAGGYRWDRGVTLGGNYTWLSGESESRGAAAFAVGETFSEKINAYLRWDPPRGRFWAEYRVRHNGEEDAALDPGQPPGPLGPVLPSFTVHTLAGGVVLHRRGAQRHTLGVVIENLTDELYAEFTNASFFRPEPGRNAILTYRWEF
jgi:outer membrane receptor protein involved in Fe transport